MAGDITTITSFFALSSAASVMNSFITPLIKTVSVLAGVACAGFLINGGFHYITSRGDPGKLEHAKNIIVKSLLGLAIVLAAFVISGILASKYNSGSSTPTGSFPKLSTINPHSSSSLIDIVLDTITGLLQNIISSVASPFISSLSYFTSGTPLMASNGSVFNLWLVCLGISDSLFVLVLAFIGLHIMSSDSLGLKDISLKNIMPRIIGVFLLANSSIFLIDIVITLSNTMIDTLRAAFSDVSLWQTLQNIANNSGSFGFASLLIMFGFMVLSVCLLVYYVGRLVTLYLGAVLSPLVSLLWLIPSFKSFAANATRTYIINIFVLFVHVTIIELAASLFSTLSDSSSSDPIMSLIVGISTLIALLKAQGVMNQMSYVSMSINSVRKIGSQFVDGASYIAGEYKDALRRV